MGDSLSHLDDLLIPKVFFNFVSCLYVSLRRDSNDFCILSYVCLSHG